MSEDDRFTTQIHAQEMLMQIAEAIHVLKKGGHNPIAMYVGYDLWNTIIAMPELRMARRASESADCKLMGLDVFMVGNAAQHFNVVCSDARGTLFTHENVMNEMRHADQLKKARAGDNTTRHMPRRKKEQHGN